MENLFSNYKRNSLRFLVVIASLFALGSFLTTEVNAQCNHSVCKNNACTTTAAGCGRVTGYCAGECFCLYSVGCYMSGGYCHDGSTLTVCGQPDSCCGGSNGEPCDGCSAKCKEYHSDDCSGDPYQTSSCKTGLACDDSKCHGAGDGDGYSYRACYAGCCSGSGDYGAIRWKVFEDLNSNDMRDPGEPWISRNREVCWGDSICGRDGCTISWTGRQTGNRQHNNNCDHNSHIPYTAQTLKTGVYSTTFDAPAGWEDVTVTVPVPGHTVWVTLAIKPTLACAQNLSATCGDDGNTATFSWDPVPNAAEYVLGINHEPFDDGFNGAGGDQWLLRSGTTNQEAIDCDADYQWSVQGVRNGEEYPFSGCSQAGPEFNCMCLHDPWWQVIDGDVATNGSLTSLIPLSTCEPAPDCDPFFDLEGPGGYPGIPSYMGEADFAEGVDNLGTVSETGWIAESRTKVNRVYDYQYFESMIPPDIIVNPIPDDVDTIQGGYLQSGTSSKGYLWHKKVGDLTIIGNVNLGKDKVILLVTGNLYIGDRELTAGAKIWLDDGEGFFAAIVGDNIEVSPKSKVDQSDPKPVLEGIFLAGNDFKTGTMGEVKEDGQFWLRGSVAAYGDNGISLQRDMTNVIPPDPNNDEDPAELFEYAPDLILTFPREFTSERLRWKEVAP